jgi:hypothetical protein
MFVQRFGADALNVLKAELKAAEDKAKKDAVAKGASAAPAAEPKDPGQLAKILFARLADAEPIGDPELAQLADARSQAIVAELSGPDGIPAERVEVKPPAVLEKKDPPTAALNLEAGR